MGHTVRPADNEEKSGVSKRRKNPHSVGSREDNVQKDDRNAEQTVT